jgi:hypothetical protein
MNKLFLFLIWAFALPVFGQQRYYVNSSATGLNNGLSWNNAFPSLQAALQLAVSGDQVWVAKGIYYPTASTDRTISFAPKSGVKLYGGFAGNETTPGQRDWVQNETILSGNIGNSTTAADNSYNVVYLSLPDLNTLLDGFTVTGGRADAPGFQPLSTDRKVSGGGVYVMGNFGEAFPCFHQCIFRDNFAKSNGAGIIINGNEPGSWVNPQFISCAFIANITLGKGGAIARFGASYNDVPVDLDSCFFSRNEAVTGACVLWRNYEGLDAVNIQNCTFEYNKSPGVTALAIDHDTSNPTSIVVANCKFDHNEGGRVLNIAPSFTFFDGKIDILNCGFTGNISWGGVVFISNVSLVTTNRINLTGLRIEGNTATGNIIQILGKESDCFVSQMYLSGDNLLSGSGPKLLNIATRKVFIDRSVFIQNDTLDAYVSAVYSDSLSVKSSIFTGSALKSYIYYQENEVRYSSPVYLNASPELKKLNIDGCIFGSSVFKASISFTEAPVTMRNSIVLHPDSLPFHFFKNSSSVNLSNNYFAALNVATLPPQFTLVGNLIGMDPLLTNIANGDFHPLPCSPLINAGDSSSVQSGDVDLDDNPRIRGNNIDIGPYETPTLALTGTPTITATCVGRTDGAFQFLATFCGALQYQWSGPGGTSGSWLFGLAAGDYSLTVSDTQGSILNIGFTVPELPAPNIAFQTTPVFCGTSTGGSAKILPTGGTPPFAYLWENGATNALQNGLAYGWYTAQVTDSKGCKAIDSVSIKRVGNLAVSIEQTPPSCYGDANGFVSVLPTNGAAPFTYSWMDGSTGEGLTDLAGGVYTGALADALGCDINWMITLDAPDSFLLTGPIIQAATDTFAADGIIELVPVGGTPPYSAMWSNGGIGLILDEVPPGTYSVTVTDQSGCTAEAICQMSYTVGVPATALREMAVWPNPSASFLHIQMPYSGLFQIALIDGVGHTVRAWVLTGDLFDLPVENFTSGLYLIKVADRKRQYWGKVYVNN